MLPMALVHLAVERPVFEVTRASGAFGDGRMRAPMRMGHAAALCDRFAQPVRPERRRR
jgi:hypothetical protein